MPLRRPGAARSRLLAALTSLLAATAVLAGIVPAASAAPSAAAPDRLTWGVQPATKKGLDTTRPYFTYSATPGAQIDDFVAVRNYGDRPLTLSLYGRDAFNSTTGAFDIQRAFEKSVDIGAHLVVGTDRITVAPRSATIVPFRIRLPMNISPGDHAAGVVAALVTQQLRGGNTRVAVEERVGGRIYIRVAGPLKPQLSVQRFTVAYHGRLNPIGSGTADVSYRVVNTGNVRLSAAQVLSLAPLIGGSKTAPGPKGIPELLPGNVSDEKVHFASVFPAIRLKAKVSLSPRAAPGTPPIALTPVTATASTWAIPWILLLTILVVILLIVAERRRRRWRRSRAARKPAEIDLRDGPEASEPVQDLVPFSTSATQGSDTRAK